jgi:hypothetical protein
MTDFSHLPWRKSSHSGTGNDTCVEVAGLSGVVAVRDSTDPDGPKLVLDRSALVRLVEEIRAGGHDC